MPEFTKGKWEVFGTGQIAVIKHKEQKFNVVCDCEFGEISEKHIEEIAANARLIAAAPEMYTFIKKIHMSAHYYLDSRFSNIFKESGEILARIDAKENGHD